MIIDHHSKKDVFCENSEITPCFTPSDVQCDLLKRKNCLLKIHMLSYFIKSIKNIGLSKDYANYPTLNSDLLLLKKNDYLGDDNFDLFECLRDPTI